MTEKTSVKLPPQSLDVEKSILGSVLIDREAMHKIVDFLSPADFYSRAHQIIYEAMLSLFEKHEPIDVLSLSNNLEEKGCLDDVGGSSYLASLAGSVPTSAHIANYGKIVQRKKMLRDLISAAHDIAGMGHQEDEDIESLLDTAEKKIFSVSQKSLTHSFARLGGNLNEAMERIANQDSGAMRGHPTKHRYLDNTLGGLQKSDLIILAARPSVGKTAFAVDIALKVAEQDIPVGIFSMEMSMDQVVDRFIAVKSGVSLWKLRTGKLSHEGDDFLKITTACDNLKKMPIFIDDGSSPNILQMRAMARRLQAEFGLGLLVVDYLQLMTPRRSYDNAVQQVTEISRGLKGLAKELNIPIIAISQLSRAVEQREGHKPRLSDLRDSGSIEQDADVVMFIHRDDKTNYEKAKEQNKLNTAQLIIAKHRNGPTGEVDFRIDPDSLRFMEIDKSRQEEVFTF
ncbi:MAG: replicative DNA helicase [Candidatus Yanofskybacteria bacterium RIFCSPLOWO2_01_FULL_44_22]|uniref:Replicative DNA helicase n=2 Tax=Candidatus Yanofskyibacteriota TaxID=1752733 RepID=A0A1F8GKE4_9BACT|nr:MAG: Replicative DNA helicase [Candidatus Yanofskybacteria bacterium GW2011_GWA2_44_9]OGN05142.1 MAG: replicative DNA helicase [Candidatus Yanofskybacteria bacterium RIFCSPHIGHO2_01_FULL_44_24]OGN25480.1 MAG: replicative DNA helicase [Candidatus Yanofskybacteria bacterium RIFCSPLOWO2_01_FULL_44_22]